MRIILDQSVSKKLFQIGFLFLFSFAFVPNSIANLSLEGYYQGKNIFVQNPESEDGFGFCVSRVTVNGEIALVDVQSSAFQIDLVELNIQIGTPVFIVIEHSQGCQPNILNNGSVMSKSTYEIESISCTPEGVLLWTTTAESGELDYLIEQYRWNKWVVIGEVKGDGNASLNSYTFNVLPHSGENKVRVSQIDNTSKKKASEAVIFTPNAFESPDLSLNKEQKIIEFHISNALTKTKYEIFDSYGSIVKKGYNSSIDYSNLKPGVYYINYDNKNERIILK